MILRGNVFSQTLQMDTGITIVAPNSFKKEGHYKVAYLLHGLCGNSESWVEYTMLPTFASEQDIIFVMPEVGRSFYTDMAYGLKYFTYIVDELPQICKSIFNISSQREDTVVIGASMGGYGALKCALSRPAQYGACCALSSACLFIKEGLDYQRQAEESGDIESLKNMYGEQILIDFRAIFGTNLQWTPEYEILELAKEVNQSAIKPRLYMACGTEDYLHGDNARLYKEMEKLDFDFTYEEWAGVHDWYFFNEALRKALKWI